MKRIKVQRGYLAQNPYKRAKFYDQGFENVRNPPRTPHLQTYGKKYDLMKLLQVVTALMQLRKNEVNNSPVTYFKEGMKRNMERIKPAIASRAAEQHFLGKPALDSLYKKTIDEIREMFIQRTQSLNKETLKRLTQLSDFGRQKEYSESAQYSIVADMLKDLVNQYKGKKELGSLASRLRGDLSQLKDAFTEYALNQELGSNATDDEKTKVKFLFEKEFKNFFDPRNLGENSVVDNSGLKLLNPIMQKLAWQGQTVPSNISSANAILDGVKDGIGMERAMEAEKIYYDPQDKNRTLYMNLTGKTPTEGDLIFTQQYVEAHPNFSEELAAAQLGIQQAESGAASYALGSKAPKKQIGKATKALNDLVNDFKRFRLVQNQTSWPVPTIPIQPTNIGSNNTLVRDVLTSIPVPSLPSSMPLP